MSLSCPIKTEPIGPTTALVSVDGDLLASELVARVRLVVHTHAMIATLTDQNHILLVPEADEAKQLAPGQDYHVMISTSGVITLRPKRKHQRSLVQHLRGLRGVEIQHRRDPIPKPIEL